MVKKTIIIFLLTISIFMLHSWQYDTLKDLYFYTIDFPDNNDWAVFDDSKEYDAVFTNIKNDAYVEVVIYYKSDAETNRELFGYLMERFQMKGNDPYDTKFCQYDAVRGEYTFNYNKNDFKMDFVIFSDDYFYYVVMGYSLLNKFNNYKDQIKGIMNSFKIYYDAGVVFSNDSNNEIKSNDKNTDTTKKEKYTFHASWEQKQKDFIFFKDDLVQAKKELSNIGEYKGNYWNGWKYFNINLSDPDYEFKFWHKFYQEMFNKNYTRINDVYEYFKEMISTENLTTYQLAEEVMKFVQAIPYERPNKLADKDSGTYNLDFFSPNQIADYGMADNDTKTLFMVLILRRLGFDAVILYSKIYEHTMVGLNINGTGQYMTVDNIRYYFIESSYEGWRIGDIPREMSDLRKWRVMVIK